MIDKSVAISFGKFLLNKVDVNNTKLNWEELFDTHQKELTKQYMEKSKSMIPSIDDVNFIVSKYFGVDPEEIKMSESRERRVLTPRQISHYICVKVLKHTLQRVADYYHGITHAAVLNSRKTITNLYDTDVNYKNHIDKLIKIVTIKSNHGEEVKGIDSKRGS